MRNKLAELAHRAWSRWMIYMFQKCHEDADGNIVIPSGIAFVWKRQLSTAYEFLTDKEKESDLSIADECIKIFESR